MVLHPSVDRRVTPPDRRLGLDRVRAERPKHLQCFDVSDVLRYHNHLVLADVHLVSFCISTHANDGACVPALSELFVVSIDVDRECRSEGDNVVEHRHLVRKELHWRHSTWVCLGSTSVQYVRRILGSITPK